MLLTYFFRCTIMSNEKIQKRTLDLPEGVSAKDAWVSYKHNLSVQTDNILESILSFKRENASNLD